MSGPSESLQRVIYASRATAGGELKVSEILETARRNNAALGVTGALLVSGPYFAQVLEGPPAAVEEIFERIQCDPRHERITVLEVAHPPARAFGAWTMAFAEEREDVSGPTLLDPAAAWGLLDRLQAALTNTAASQRLPG
ncbi:BLUF domain-containing protein [Roseomonas sp. PWR1]|uniref:BLUF domain-containing protein n=1 Tax=Roseomonas nitratireducens TaxID=2820810 RepID=A0ABS4AT75_9PROT|nr:BLUF domain-containing protein [Neoroseomonas nitratireducens]MBP0464575.1 BLUF domain-containing protein [Neoroseomonas nitratireducens]